MPLDHSNLSLPDCECELLIIGGGIHGTSLAHMAQANGIQCILIEQGDLGQGASSASSKLIHGGLRYLENYDFNLVYEAAHERKVQSSIAPHLVEDADFVFPLTPYTRYPKWMVKTGIMMYEMLAGKNLLHKHHLLSKSELKTIEPELNLHNGGFGYSDAIGDDIRMVIENAQAAHQLGAQIWNYHKALQIKKDKEDYLIEVEKVLTRERFWIRTPKIAMNLGPNTDFQLEEWGFASKNKKTVLSQGVHIVADYMGFKHPFILPVPHSTRYFFVVPWQNQTLIGTTETPLKFNEAIDPMAQPQEIEELKELFHLYFPNLELQPICTTCGVRPLAKAQSWFRFSPTSSVQASRKHIVHKIAPNCVALVGGKYTIHRLMAKDVLKKLHLPHSESLTNKLLPGSVNFVSHPNNIECILAAQPMISKMTAERWSKMYGSQALKISNNSLLGNDDEALVAELKYTIQNEFVLTLEDFLRRRSHLYFKKDGAIPLMNLLLPHLNLWPHYDHTVTYLKYLQKQNHSCLGAL